ncbi:hypothetical protein G7Y79_00032g067080 [Physcia stellaris]|nr:hypothetical protein G7Y79_00032g067080 [Physcia stellaris]
MLILLWLSLSSLATALTLPSSNHTTVNSLSTQLPSANLSWPFILPYTWKDRDSGMFYAYGFKHDIGQLLALAQDLANEGATQHGLRTLYPSENGEQRFSVSSGVLEIRIANVGKSRFSWFQLLNVLESLEIILIGGQRYYKTWFEFWESERFTDRAPIGRGKLFKPSFGVALQKRALRKP